MKYNKLQRRAFQMMEGWDGRGGSQHTAGRGRSLQP
jgi:hypothetical protein